MIYSHIETVLAWDRENGKYINRRVRIRMDTVEIARAMAAQAYRNKSKKSKEIAGAIVVEAMDVV